MNYKNYMRNILWQLGKYKIKVDEMATAYLADCKEHEEELRCMEGIYTAEYIEESRENWRPETDYGRAITTEREKYRKIVNRYLDRLKEEVDSYFQIPVNPGFASAVSAIKTLGVTLNNREFKLLQGASGGYWGRLLLNELAVSRTKEMQKAVLEGKETRSVARDVKNPYGAVEVPNIEEIYEGLQNVENAVNEALDSYCGENYALKSIVFPVTDTMSIVRMTAARKYFDEEECQGYSDFLGIMDGVRKTLPEKKRKRELTEEDKRLIESMIDPSYPSLAKEKAVEIAKSDERLAEMLRLDERYGEAVKEALKEVNEPANKKSIEN